MLKDTINTFKQQLQINLSPAGIWKYVDGVKVSVECKRYDYEPWNKHPKDNMGKFRLDDTPYIVIDVDGNVLNQIERDFPSTRDTFYTVTSKPYKRHYYLLPPEGKPKPLIRKIAVRGPGTYDVLSTGILFEGHPSQYQKVVSKPVQKMNEAEFDRFTNKAKPLLKNVMYFNRRMKALIVKFLDKKITRQEENALIKLVTPKEYTEAITTKRIPWPELNHDNFNSIAYIVFNNGAVDTYKEGQPFLEQLLTDVYKVDLNSKQTQKHFYDSILITLKHHPSFTDDSVLEDMSLKDQLNIVKLDSSKGLMKFIGNEQWKYAAVHLETLDIVQLSNDSHFLSEATTRKLLKVGIKDFTEYHNAMPTVKIVNNPYKERFYFDVDNDIMIYNMAKQTQYYKQAIKTPSLSRSNIVRKVIESYYGDYAELYFHWLAHTMYSSRTPHTVLVTASPPEAPAGTGKTLTSSSIPQRLIYAAQTIGEDILSSGWGQVFLGKRLISLNDLRSAKQWESFVYPEIRNKTTGGQRRQEVLKYGGFVEHTNAVSFSVSANFLPPLDPHDRRCFVVMPQQIYGNTRMLSYSEATILNKMFEVTPLNTFIPELQELANFLLYLFKEEHDKYLRELYIEAPKTKGRSMCLRAGKGIARTLLTILTNNPGDLQLEVRVDNDVVISQNALKNERDVVAFIVMQTKNGRATLPWMFFSELLTLVQNDRAIKKSSPASVAQSLGITKENYRRVTTKSNLKYKNPKILAEYGLSPAILKWSSTNLIELRVDIAWYVNRLKELS